MYVYIISVGMECEFVTLVLRSFLREMFEGGYGLVGFFFNVFFCSLVGKLHPGESLTKCCLAL